MAGAGEPNRPGERTLQEEIQRQLEKRPRLTIRFRIALVFVVCTLFIASITIGSTLMLSHVRTKMRFLEAVDEYAFEIQEARRYEKNYFLYGTSPNDALEHVYRAQRLLDANAQGVEDIVGKAAAQRWKEALRSYEGLLEQLATRAPAAPHSERGQSEAQLRRFGTAILADASEMIARERQAMDELLHSASLGAMALLGMMVLLIVILADQLTRQVIRRISRFISYVERIAEGDFSPIRPARRYKDEFSTLALAINRMLEELRTRQEQLLQSRKMAAVGSLTSGIAHELNNPLNNISLTVETLLDDFEEIEDPQRRKLLDDIFTQVQRASATVRNLLDFTRKDHPVFTPIAVGELLETSLRLVGNEMSLARVATEVDVPADLPPVKGNPRNLQQVFLNLFLNAMDAMPGGGRLEVTAGRKNGSVEIAVRDTGVGIPAEQLDQIFEPFFTTKEAGEGTGLGLSVSYSIVEKHGGRLLVESQPGQGTTFRVVLPVADTKG
jgi:two-component system NtrC family sensor kinase